MMHLFRRKSKSPSPNPDPPPYSSTKDEEDDLEDSKYPISIDSSASISQLYLYTVAWERAYPAASAYITRQEIVGKTIRDPEVAQQAAYISTPLKRGNPTCTVTTSDGRRIGMMVWSNPSSKSEIHVDNNGRNIVCKLKRTKWYRIGHVFEYEGKHYEWWRPTGKSARMVLSLADADVASTVDDSNGHDENESALKAIGKEEDFKNDTHGKVVGILNKGPSKKKWDHSLRLLSFDPNFVDENVALLSAIAMWEYVKEEYLAAAVSA